MDPIYVIRAEDAKLHIAKGNSKIGKGIWSFSTLPGNKDHLLMLDKTVVLTNVPGTCSKHCDSCFDHGCYAVKSAKLHHNAVVRAWAENTLLLRSGTLFKKIHEFIEKKNRKYYSTGKPEDIVIRTFRINVSGEIEDKEEFVEWNKIALMHPEITFSVYTKNFDALEEFLDFQNDRLIANNFVINISQWHHVADDIIVKYPGKFNIFEYDDSNLKNSDLSTEDKIRLATMPHCPAVTCAGKHAKTPSGEAITCDQCLRCYRKTGAHTAVYAH